MHLGPLSWEAHSPNPGVNGTLQIAMYFVQPQRPLYVPRLEQVLGPVLLLSRC